MRRKLLVSVSTMLSLLGCAPEGPTAFVDFNIPPDSECIVSPGGGDALVFIPTGMYDIAADGNPSEPSGENYCENPYVLSLRVNSQLRASFDKDLGRAEPNVLQITQAEVRLMDPQQATLDFQGVMPPLPNPFLVNTNLSITPTENEEPSLGIVVVEVIPTAYAGLLAKYVNSQILAEVKLFGTTLGDVDVDIKPYLYPIRICNGCRTLCVRGDGIDDDDRDSDQCQDNAGFDQRICYDPNC